MSLRAEIPILRKPLLFRLVFRRALERRFPNGTSDILLGMLLVWVRFVFSLRFSLFVGWHANHLLSCRVFVRSAFIHSQHRVDYAKLPLDIVRRVAEETGTTYEAEFALYISSHCPGRSGI